MNSPITEVVTTFLLNLRFFYAHKSIGHKQVDDLTENRDILNKYTISLILENVVSSNIEISQVRPVPISPITVINKKLQVEPVVIWCVSTTIICQ